MSSLRYTQRELRLRLYGEKRSQYREEAETQNPLLKHHPNAVWMVRLHVVELNENDKLFGKYDLDARQSGTILKAYIDYNEAIADLQTRIKPENQKLDILRHEDLLDLINESPTL